MTSTPTRATVAAVIPTRNVAGFITGALDSLWFCDEIIIVDMNSTDGTRAVVERHGNVRYFAREGYIYENFNFGVDQARSDWIIRLDSDERLSPELQDEILELLASNPSHRIYDAPFTSVLVGQPLRHGSAWEQPVRTTLFRREAMRYRCRSEHEDLGVVDGGDASRGRLQHRYWHFSTPALSVFLAKVDYYTEKDYERARADEVQVLPPGRLLWVMSRAFIRQYVLSRGYRDGYAGFAMAALNSTYLLVHYLKGWEKKGRLRTRHSEMWREYDEMLARHRTARDVSLRRPAEESVHVQR